MYYNRYTTQIDDAHNDILVFIKTIFLHKVWHSNNLPIPAYHILYCISDTTLAQLLYALVLITIIYSNLKRYYEGCWNK